MAKNTIVIAAPGEEADRGAVYVYEYQGEESGGWTQTQRLTSDVWSYKERDHFGIALSLSPDADTMVVGAPGYDHSYNTSDSGAVFVFRRSQVGSGWVTRLALAAYPGKSIEI